MPQKMHMPKPMPIKSPVAGPKMGYPGTKGKKG